jgi:hypothetical protein
MLTARTSAHRVRAAQTWTGPAALPGPARPGALESCWCLGRQSRVVAGSGALCAAVAPGAATTVSCSTVTGATVGAAIAEAGTTVATAVGGTVGTRVTVGTCVTSTTVGATVAGRTVRTAVTETGAAVTAGVGSTISTAVAKARTRARIVVFEAHEHALLRW